MIKPVFLWTDSLLMFLVVTIVAFIFYVRSKEHLHEPWREIFKSRIALASMLILLIYILVALLDSMHFRQALPETEGQLETQYSGDVLSVLDVLMTPLREQVEITYSAPFAAHAHSRETRTGEDGSQTRIYPRLKFGGVHLTDPQTERSGDVLQRLFIVVVKTVLGIIGLYALLAILLARRWQTDLKQAAIRLLSRKQSVSWKTLLLMMALVMFVIIFIADIGRHYHILGTDKVGQDVLYQAIKSIRTGLIIGTLTTLIMLPFAVTLGLMAGYYRGWVDDVIQYLYTTLNSIPGVLLIAAAILMLQVYMANHPDMFETMAERADMRLLFLCVILGVTTWTGLCRLLRGESLKLKELEYVQAADAFGVSGLRILTRHLLPNLTHLILIAVVLDFSGLVLAEAVLSYVGVGVDPTMLSWGNMINRARLEMAREPMVWWSLLAAFIFMFTLVLSANLFSDAVRDAFDPRMRHR
ncbi:MAG: ABC transporter permease [Gammaproteobacteria bacterium]